MSAGAPFALSRVYEVRVEKGEVTLTRLSPLVSRHVWLITAFALAVGTPGTALMMGEVYGLFALVLGFVLLVAGNLRMETGSRALVRNPRTVTLRGGVLADTDGYRSATRSPRALIVDGHAHDDEPGAVLVLTRRNTRSTTYVVSVVSATRIVEVEAASDVTVANELAADLRQCLDLPEGRLEPVEEPPVEVGGVYGLGTVVEVFALPACLVVPLLTTSDSTRSQLLAVATAVGVGFVLVDVLARRLALHGLGRALPAYMKSVRQLASNDGDA